MRTPLANNLANRRFFNKLNEFSSAKKLPSIKSRCRLISISDSVNPFYHLSKTFEFEMFLIDILVSKSKKI